MYFTSYKKFKDFLKRNFTFTGKLRGRYSDFPSTPLPLHVHNLPHYKTQHQDGTLVHMMNLH